MKEKKRKIGREYQIYPIKKRSIEEIWKNGTAMKNSQGVALLLNLAAPCHGSSLSRVYARRDLIYA